LRFVNKMQLFLFLSVYLIKNSRIMPPMRIVLFLLLFMYCNSNSIMAQSDANILKILKKSENDFKEANFEQSLINSRIALNSATYVKNNYFIARSYKIIAANYNELVEFDKAIFFYKKALIYAYKTDNDTLKNKICNNLGNIYCFEKKRYTEGIDYYKKSIGYCLKINDSSQIYFTTLNISWAYIDIASFSQGEKYLNFLNKNQKKYGDESTDIILNMLNGIYCHHKKDILKADAYFLKAIELGKKSTEKSDLSYVHLEYSKFLDKNGRYKEAYENLKKYNTITEELYDKEKL
jgi:tetratricopeptide (TPR) repeat protein